MALTDEQKKALVERLRLARAKKAAEKKKNPELASDKPAPKKKRVPVVVEEATMPSAPSAPIIQPQTAPLDLPEPMDHPLYKVPEAPTVTTGANGEPKKTKTKFMKVVWYKEPTKKQMKALEKIAEDDVEDLSDASDSDESLPPPPEPVKAPTKSKPRAIPTPRAKPVPSAPAPQVDERQEYLKRMAAMYFN